MVYKLRGGDERKCIQQYSVETVNREEQRRGAAHLKSQIPFSVTVNGAGGVEQAHFPPVLGKCQMAKREGRGEERKGRFV